MAASSLVDSLRPRLSDHRDSETDSPPSIASPVSSPTDGVLRGSSSPRQILFTCRRCGSSAPSPAAAHCAGCRGAASDGALCRACFALHAREDLAGHVAVATSALARSTLGASTPRRADSTELAWSSGEGAHLPERIVVGSSSPLRTGSPSCDFACLRTPLRLPDMVCGVPQTPCVSVFGILYIPRGGVVRAWSANGTVLPGLACAAVRLSDQTLESAYDAASHTLILADEDGGGSRLAAVTLATKALRWVTARGAFKSSCNGVAVLPARPPHGGGLVFASAFWEDRVYVHRLSDGVRVAELTVSRPESLAVDAETATLFVSSAADGDGPSGPGGGDAAHYKSVFDAAPRFCVRAWKWAGVEEDASSVTGLSVASAASAVSVASLPPAPSSVPQQQPPLDGRICAGGGVSGGRLQPLGCLIDAGVSDVCRPLAVLVRSTSATPSTSPSSTSSVLLVGTYSPPAIRVLSLLPGHRLLHVHTLPPALRVAGLAADPTGSAIVVMDSASSAALVLPWPLDEQVVRDGDGSCSAGGTGTRNDAVPAKCRVQ